MHELLMAALPVTEITIIKRDFDLLCKLIPNITNDVQTQMIPYYALFCYEAITYLKKYDQLLILYKQANIPLKI